jgi:nucleoside 2-deoxyribosyltransferase
MKKIFLATSFSGQVDITTNQVQPQLRGGIEAILKELRSEGEVEVFCAIEHEGWAFKDIPSEVGVLKDLEEIDAADTMIALVQDVPSVGVQTEIGYAVAKDKQVVIAMEAGSQISYFNQGLVSAGKVTLVTYDNAVTLKTQLPIAVHAPEGL